MAPGRSLGREGLLRTCFMYMLFPELCSAQPICEAIHNSPGWRYRFGTVKYGGQLKLMEITRAPTQVGDGNFRLSTRFLEHHPLTSPPTNQKKVTHPAVLTPNFAYKNFSPKTVRGFEHEPPILLAWPCNKPFSKAGFQRMKIHK